VGVENGGDPKPVDRLFESRWAEEWKDLGQLAFAGFGGWMRAAS
jgi:hypothetical protein